MTPAATLGLGLVLGLRHAIDPDHVVAMGTILARDNRLGRAIATGAWWGVGHTVTVLAVGALMIVGGVRVPDRATTATELLVAAMMVTLGVAALRGPRGARASSPARERRGQSAVRPLVIGLIHGLAGSAAVTLLALATLDDARAAMLYLALFGVGTVAGMVVLTGFLAASLRWLGARSALVPRWLSRVSGTLSVTVGVVVVTRLAIIYI